MKKPIDIKGQTFGRLTVLNYTHSNNDKKACWDCVCSCGNIVNVAGKNLRNGNTKSCGCLSKEVISKVNLTHGDCVNGKTKEYHIWRSIKDRCLNPKNKNYNRYGGRGISICNEWENDYSKFLKDMGRSKGKKCTIERIDNNKNYSPDNCRWATWKEQQNNKSSSRLIIFKGKKMNVESWSKITGIKYGTIIMRLNRGWSIEKTLTYGCK